jgi:transcription-repair coupling factor (superfamily II helicase)
VEKDLTERTTPMDRLICGDVGFGKTEVALRAIFCVVSAGKQAMVLAPTIVLVRQHYEVIRERFSDYPHIKVAILSRFQVNCICLVCWVNLRGK